jgi:hypothetical protein
MDKLLVDTNIVHDLLSKRLKKLKYPSYYSIIHISCEYFLY